VSVVGYYKYASRSGFHRILSISVPTLFARGDRAVLRAALGAEQCDQALAVLGARGAAAQVRVHAGDGGVGVAAGQLDLHSA
jgi:hypothetical protein